MKDQLKRLKKKKKKNMSRMMKNQTSGVVKGSYHQRSGHEGVNGGGVARLQITKILGSQTA